MVEKSSFILKMFTLFGIRSDVLISFSFKKITFEIYVIVFQVRHNVLLHFLRNMKVEGIRNSNNKNSIVPLE